MPSSMRPQDRQGWISEAEPKLSRCGCRSATRRFAASAPCLRRGAFQGSFTETLAVLDEGTKPKVDLAEVDTWVGYLGGLLFDRYCRAGRPVRGCHNRCLILLFFVPFADRFARDGSEEMNLLRIDGLVQRLMQRAQAELGEGFIDAVDALSPCRESQSLSQGWSAEDRSSRQSRRTMY